MPAEIERYNPEKKKWAKRGVVKPDGSRTLIDVKPDGTKAVVFIQCASDGSESIIQRMELGEKSFIEPGRMRVFHPEKDPVEIAKLRTGDPPFETTIHDLDEDSQPTRYRFSHK